MTHSCENKRDQSVFIEDSNNLKGLLKVHGGEGNKRYGTMIHCCIGKLEQKQNKVKVHANQCHKVIKGR